MRALLVTLLVACGSSHGPNEPGRPPPQTDAPADNCTSSDDCDLVDACCGCNAGGEKIAIRKDAVAAYQASRQQRCGGQMCAMHISTDPTCDAEAICGSENRCRVAPHMSH